MLRMLVYVYIHLIKDFIILILLGLIFFPIILNSFILNISNPMSCEKSFKIIVILAFVLLFY